MNIKDLVKKITPKGVLNPLSKYAAVRVLNKRWLQHQEAYSIKLNKLKEKKEPLNVIFIVLYSSVWKYDSLYRLMEKDSRFKPLIIVCPVVDGGENHKKENYLPTYNYFKGKGYNVIKAYDEVNDHYTPIDTFHPDVIFYSYIWSSHVVESYRVQNLPDYLNCLVPYSFSNVAIEETSASFEQKMMWRYYCECEDNKLQAQSFDKKHLQNIKVVGYPIYDEILECSPTGSDWKLPQRFLKRIIWAPHHSINENPLLMLSTFLLYYDEMLELAEKYKDKAQFVFKPHPQLRIKLDKIWGVERTQAYYDKWANGENTSIACGNYIDLFKSSDAMIHDSGSFIAEYLYVNKPVMFLESKNKKAQFNVVGTKAYNCHYHGYSNEDIEEFIQKVVIDGADTMEEQRTAFYNDILVPPHGKMVAENIIDDIINAINNIED